MPSISRGLYKWTFQSGAALEDLADRLNHVWTVILLLLLAAIISWKHGYSEPISCWTPRHFEDSHTTYTSRVCWHSNVICQPDGREHPILIEKENYVERVDSVTNETYVYVSGMRAKPGDCQTTLYQWVPLILALQALLFKLPNILMYTLHGYSGLSFDKIQSLTSGFEALTMEDRLLLGRQTAQYIQTWLNGRLVKLPWRTFTVIWFVVKLFYVINVVTQLVLVDKFLSTKEIDNATSYGELIYDNFREENITLFRVAPVFPRKIRCEFEMLQFMNVHMYTVFCALPANIFTEHAYMFLWVWLVFVATVSSVSLVIWIARRLVPIFRRRYVQQYLDTSNPAGPPGTPHLGLEEFSDSHIGEDGLFVLKLIGHNSSDLLVKDVVSHLWTMSLEAQRFTGIVTIPAVQPSTDAGVEPICYRVEANQPEKYGELKQE